LFEARVRDISGSQVELEVLSCFEAKAPPVVDMALAVTRAPRLDMAVEKCSEIGVRRIIPFISSRSIWRGDGRSNERKRDRLVRKAETACKQSGQPFFPEVSRVISFNSLVGIIPSYAGAYLAHRGGENLEVLPREMGVGGVLGIVGPEGGLTSEELDSLQEAKAVLLSLGHFRLRSETAAICLLFKLRIILSGVQDGGKNGTSKDGTLR
ncbi:MAG: RNA methyltransferase, partial [Candidatus Krumholzibacteria bacterium]|nr:RNA methyltransferase [Candidatus Krumholzibacteria bacterium]